MNKEYLQRLDRIDSTVKHQHSDCVPIVGDVMEWAYYYNGYKPIDGLNNKQIAVDVFDKLCSDFYWDGMIPGSIRRISPRIYELLKGGHYHYNEEGLLLMSPLQIRYMADDEYPALIADPYGFIIDKVFTRKFELFREKDAVLKQKNLDEVAQIYCDYYNDKTFVNIAEKEYDNVIITSGLIASPADIILNQLRGLRNIIKDIKSTPELVAEAAEALMPYALDRVASMEQGKGKSILMPTHLTAFLNPKDFEKVYWPTFKRYVEILVERGHTVICNFEKNIEHLYDYLQDLPPHAVIGYFEGDDLVQAKKVLGKNMCIMGGMPIEYLRYRTKAECIDYAKSLIDDLAYDGGYIFGTNRPVMYPDDANVDNIRAVNEFVHKYGVYN